MPFRLLASWVTSLSLTGIVTDGGESREKPEALILHGGDEKAHHKIGGKAASGAVDESGGAACKKTAQENAHKEHGTCLFSAQKVAAVTHRILKEEYQCVVHTAKPELELRERAFAPSQSTGKP